jgi:hypothetical protein
LKDLSSESQAAKSNGSNPNQVTSNRSPKSSEKSSKKKSSIHDKNRFRTVFLEQLKYGEHGSFKNKGFQASEIYYAMTAEIPEVGSYEKTWQDGQLVPDLDRPIYAIDMLEEFQQELILDGLEEKYKQRMEKLEKFHARNRREEEERYQNYIAYRQQKEKSAQQQCLPLS